MLSKHEIRKIERFQLRNQARLTNLLVEENRQVNVLFMLPELGLWDVYAPIYRAMEDSNNFAPLVVAFTRVDISSEKSPQQIINILDEMSIRYVFLEASNLEYPDLAEFEPDLLFYTLGSVAYPEPYRIESVSSAFLTCYLAYGFLIYDQPEYQFGQSFHHAAWRIFAITDREKKEYEKWLIRKKSNVVTTGYTKFDLYPRLVPPAPSRPRIIWSPHWSIKSVYPALKFGTFDQICFDMVRFMADHKQIDFVFKPHPNLKYAVETSMFMEKREWQDFLSGLEGLPNVVVYQGGNNIDLFVQSSAMITDCNSFLAEYIPSGRPLLFLNRRDRTKFAEIGELIVGQHYVGEGVDDIEKFVESVLRGQDPMREERLAFGSQHLGIGATPATQKIMHNLSVGLGLA